MRMGHTVISCELHYPYGNGALRLIQRKGQQFDDDDGDDGHGGGVHGGDDVQSGDDDVPLFISLK